jgi:glycine dehydrogenase subunit 1
VFNEFVLEFPRSVKIINQSLLREKIIGPMPLGVNYPQQTKCGVMAVTETMPRTEIERFAAVLRQILQRPV